MCGIKQIRKYVIIWFRILKIPRNQMLDMAVIVVKRLFKNLQRPVVSACEYDKEHKCWVVRFDNADTHYVRFLKRDDGGFDTEYSSEIFD